MKRMWVIAFLLLLLLVAWCGTLPSAVAYPAHKGSTFRAGQLANARVKTAYRLNWNGIRQRLQVLGVDSTHFSVLIRGFKQEAELEVWVKSARNSRWQLYTTYAICAASGDLGPKRCQGDGQVPEGFYYVSVFNPTSAYHLSLGVSYPNAADKVFACKPDPGGAIMIHGNCVTIGCLPLTDVKIRELYVLCVEAKDGGQAKIPIHLFPARLTTEKLAALKRSYTDPKLHTFWANLKTGFQAFETDKQLPTITIDAKGNYVVK